MKHLFALLSITLSFTMMAYGQSSRDYQHWLEDVESKFPGLNYNALTNGSPTYQRIRLELLEDTNFVPIFGQPFTELSPSRLDSIKKEIRKLKAAHNWAQRLDFYTLNSWSPRYAQQHRQLIAVQHSQKKTAEPPRITKTLNISQADNTAPGDSSPFADRIAARRAEVEAQKAQPVSPINVPSANQEPAPFFRPETELDLQRQNTFSEQQKVIKDYRDKSLKARQQITDKYQATFPTLTQLAEIKSLASTIEDSTASAKVNRFVNALARLGYTRSDKIYSDINTFTNPQGFEIVTVRTKDKSGTFITAASFEVKHVEKDILTAYLMDITSQARIYQAPLSRPWSPDKNIPEKLEPHAVSGGTLYSFSYINGELTITALDNSSADIPVVSEATGYNQLKITPWSTQTDIEVQRGDTLRISAVGKMTLGIFPIPYGPEGIRGYNALNINPNFNHACLIGRIGDGEWFYIGSQTKITAPQSGRLQLRINDNSVSDNAGFFTVNYQIN